MEFITTNGVEVRINIADFITSMKLKKEVFKAVKDSNIALSKLDLDKLLSGHKENISGAVKSGALDSLMEVILTVDSNDKVEEAIFKCLARCTYNGEKITRSTFEPIEARENYYETIIYCLMENLSPFYAPLRSKFKELEAKKKLKDPKQNQ
jgi:hypothetical protein